MTRRERRAVIKAMALIHADEDAGGNYEGGMDILARLAGLETFEGAMLEAKPISIFELAKRLERSADGGEGQSK